MMIRTVEIINKLGLHARAAAKFVNVTSRYLSQIEVRKGDQVVNGKSIMGIMMLAASQSTRLEITTQGEDEEALMREILALIEARFGEDE